MSSKLALENAKAKAEILAKQSQAKLGKVIVVREQSQAPRPMAAMTMGADYAVEIGTQSVNAEVSVEFQLLEHWLFVGKGLILWLKQVR